MPVPAHPDQPEPVLDVLIPHHADPAGLALTLDSVAAQGWCQRPGNKTRIVIVDDGSAEADLAEVRRLCADFQVPGNPEVLLDHLPRNHGRPFTRNRLLELARARHIAWLDAGDTWYPDKIAVQFAHLEQCIAAGQDPGRLWVTCAYDWDQRGQCGTRLQVTTGDQFAALLEGDTLRGYLWTMIGTRQAFARAGRFDADLPRLQDLDYCLAFIAAGGRMTAPDGDQPLCRYVKSHIGRDARQIAAGYARILAKHSEQIETYPPAFRAGLRGKGAILAARFARANRARLLALRYVLLAFRFSPRLALSWLVGSLGRSLRRLVSSSPVPAEADSAATRGAGPQGRNKGSGGG